MKKILCCILIFVIFASGCTYLQGGLSSETVPQTDKQKSQEYYKGVWISYTEINSMLESEDFKEEFEKCVENCVSAGMTDMFVHVRPFCDSYYKSEYFPLNEAAKSCDFDILEYMTQICHKNSVRFHAWINPYRVRTADSDITALDASSPAYLRLTDSESENDTDVVILNGIYLNPCSASVRALVINGIREILLNYDVDGIHFDDYFYPTTSEDFDKTDYEKYCNGCETPLPLDEWRRANVNSLISGSYTAIKFIKKDVLFSVSPAASIKNGREKLYADVTYWIESGCVDMIIPQLYFGYEYPEKEFCFDTLLKAWKKAVKGSDVLLVIGLASYKTDTQQLPDKDEWKAGNNIIKRQENDCLNDPYVSGHCYFSYTYFLKQIGK